MINRVFLTVLFVLLICSCQQTPLPQKTESIPANSDERAAKLSQIKEKIVPFFKPMRVQEGDWLESFPEEGQTFEQYLKANPTLPTTERQIIYIQPVGEFTATQKKVLQLTAEYMKAFYNLPVKLNEIKPLRDIPKGSSRKHPIEKNFQVKSGYFLNELLPKILPNDAAVLICFTNFDLYPEDSWNYVFGQANLQNRVGVWSMWRFGNPDESAESYRLFLSRTLKVAMHETGHTFTMLHCTKYECIMSGSNHLLETDRRPLDACPECMAKIAWALKYDPIERYQKLAEFWKKQGWADEEKNFLEKAAAIGKIAE